MSLELAPETEREVTARAAAEGVSASEFINRLMRTASPAPKTPAERVKNLLAQWQQADRTPVAPSASNDGTMTPSEALFREWDEEDAKMTESERRAQWELWEAFQQGIDSERAATGMRLVF